MREHNSETTVDKIESLIRPVTSQGGSRYGAFGTTNTISHLISADPVNIQGYPSTLQGVEGGSEYWNWL